MKYPSYCILALLVFSLSILVKGKTIKFTVSAENNLYNQICKSVLEGAFDKTPIKLSFVSSKSYISIEDSNSGFTDAETCRINGASKKWPNLIQIFPSISSFHGAILTKGKKFKKITKKERLKTLRIGILRGHIYSAKITKDINPELVKQYADNITTLKMLKQDKLDIAILMLGDTAKLLAENPNELSGIIYNNKSFVEHKLYFYVHKKNKKHVEEITNLIFKYVDNGEAQKVRSSIFKKFGIVIEN